MPSTSLNAMEASRPPAFVQPAALRNCVYYKNAIIQIDEHHRKKRGEIIKEFKASGVWKEEYKTWNDCCNVLLEMTRRNANLLISESGKEISHLEDNPTRQLPPPDHIKDAPKAKETAPKDPEPKDNHKPEPKEPIKPPTDLSGAIIPQDLLALFDRKSEVTQIEFYASKLHAFFQSVQKDSDPLWRKLRMMATIQTFTSSAQTMQWAIRECCPEVVCPGCGAGSKQNDCNTCDGSGAISEVRWNRDWVKSTDKAKQAIVAGRVK